MCPSIGALKPPGVAHWDVVGWRGHAADGGGQEAILRPAVVLGDGAKWIWDEVAATFGGERTEIVDWWHSARAPMCSQ